MLINDNKGNVILYILFVVILNKEPWGDAVLFGQ